MQRFRIGVALPLGAEVALGVGVVKRQQLLSLLVQRIGLLVIAALILHGQILVVLLLLGVALAVGVALVDVHGAHVDGALAHGVQKGFAPLIGALGLGRALIALPLLSSHGLDRRSRGL